MPNEHNLIKGFVFRFVKKRIAGSTLSSALNEVRENNSKGLHTTLTFLNDSVDDTTKARYNANTYVQISRQASRLHLNADISVRLSQIGLNLNHGIMDACIGDIIKAAKDMNTRIWIENENEVETDTLLGIYRRLKTQYANIGIEIPVTYNLEVSTIKKFMKPNDMVKLTSYPSSDDEVEMELEEANGNGKKAKNSKKENGKEKDKANKYIVEKYIANIGKLLQADVNVAIFEHDPKIISKIAGTSKEYKKSLIFELPLGYNNKKLGKLQKAKLNLSIYTPYGKDWTSYVINRLTVKHGRIRQLAAKVL